MISLVVSLISILLSIFSTIVMGYVALATPIGPWIAPTLVFIVLLCSRLCIRVTVPSTAYAVSAGSIGGILATACAFSFPTLYFLDPILFNSWMSFPLFFVSVLGGFCFLAGLFGFLIADISEKELIDKQDLSFPIGQLIYKMILAQENVYKAYQLMAGFCAAALYALLQRGCFGLGSIIPKTITLLPSFQVLIFCIPRVIINLDIAPMVWAIGFITGHVIALPLAVGACATICVTGPLQRLLFSHVSSVEFMLAFCSGIVLWTTLTGIMTMPRQLINGIRQSVVSLKTDASFLEKNVHARSIILSALMGCVFILFFSYFSFPWYLQLYLVVCAGITTYQIASIAGRIGLALLGRFATFVMVPAMLIFNLSYVQLVFIATFVEISGGVAADILFGRKLARLADISREKMRYFQLIGLFISSAIIGIVFWLLINHFGLGSPELFAYRAQSRQLLIQAQQFDYLVLIVGALFGMLLQFLSLNPMLVLGGLLMPLDMTLGLVAGGLCAYCSSDKEEWYPLWSGIFAGTSICMLLRAVF